MNIDLNINNYNINELKRFFKLTNNYSNAELDKKVTDMVTVVSSSTESTYKYQTIDFITQAKEILTKSVPDQYPYNSNSQVNNLINGDQNVTKIPLENPLPDPKSNVGQILNPRSSSHQSMETTYIESDKALKYDTFISNYVFNTRYRDDFFNTTTNNCTFSLPTIIKNVTSITLSSIQYPNVIFTFSDENHTTQIYIHEDTTNNEGIVTIPEGNYDITTFPSVLQAAINDQIIGPLGPIRFSVAISPSTHFTTISNSTYTFTMELITSYSKNLGENCNTDNYNFTFKNGSNDPKQSKKIQPSDLYCSLGYMIGYRKISYSGATSYTSESLFDFERYNYIYFALNDYVGNQNINNIGIFPQSVLDQNILALVPINSPPFTTTFSDGSTYIYRTRNYNGPVNLKKISIQLINPMGSLADIHLCEYTFCLQIQTIANMTVKNKYKMSSNF